MSNAGIFYGIGVGPGDPELLTVKAINTIQKVDTIIAPKTEKKDDSLALSIVKPHLKKDVEIVYQTFPMVKDFSDTAAETWQANKSEILERIKAGKNVAFLTLGDPLFFSTFIYIFELLTKEKIRIELIPGIPAFLAIASRIQKPVVCGDEVLSIIPATADLDKIDHALKNSDASILMKVYKNFPEIVDVLEKNDFIDEAVLISRCGLKDEKRIDDLKSHTDEKLNYLSTIQTRRQP